MGELLAWALQRARLQTFTLVEDLTEEQMCLQLTAGENHPAWILGHLLLGDIYLLFMLGIQDLSQDFSDLLGKYGPGTVPISSLGHYDSKYILVERLDQTGSLRHTAICKMNTEELARPTPDAILARAQPTLAHHLQTLVFHEGHHGGQLSAWRKAKGLPSIRGAFAPQGF